MSNRVIKFRGYSHGKREWVYGHYVSDGVSHWIAVELPNFTTSTTAVSPDSLGQFTGLHDKNGVEIYEGDVLYHKIQGKRQVIYPMHDQVATFGLASSDGKLNTLQDSEFLYAVIGNIYENPELLQGE